MLAIFNGFHTLQQEDRFLGLRDELYDLRNQASHLIGLKAEPTLFVKPTDWRTFSDGKIADLYQNAASLNRWSVYNMYRFAAQATIAARVLTSLLMKLLYMSTFCVVFS